MHTPKNVDIRMNLLRRLQQFICTSTFLVSVPKLTHLDRTPRMSTRVDIRFSGLTEENPFERCTYETAKARF